jgi:competence protein ComEC
VAAAIVLVFFLFAFCLYRKMHVGVMLVYFIFFGLGIILSQAKEALPKNDIVVISKFYRRQPLSIKGIIISDIRSREFFNRKKTDFVFEVQQFKTKYGWKKVHGKILVQIFRVVEAHYGDELLLEGKLHFPYNFSEGKNFSYKEYLRARGVSLVLSVKKNATFELLRSAQGNKIKDFFYQLRKKLKVVFNDYLIKNESAIMRAMILGDRADIPRHINNLFVQTGTAHILAISGLHVGIVAGLFLIFLKMFSLPRKLYFGLAAFLLIGYALLTGLRPSVVRATIISVVFLLSFIVERENDSLNTLALSAFLILIFNPLNLFDIGFQLSFACILSILLLVPEAIRIFLKIFPFKKNFFHYSVATSFAVWIGSIGLIVYYFNMVTPITIIANLFIIPLSSILVALGFGLLVFSFIFPPASVLFALCLKICLNLLVGLIFLFNKVPGAYYIVNNVTYWNIMGYYIFILIFFFLWKSLSSKPSQGLSS